MAIESLNVKEYRSVRDLSLTLKSINVLVGANGCGKSNLYQSMYLLSAAANGQFARAIAAEGGMPSVVWAGIREPIWKPPPVRMTLSVTVDTLYYELVCGFIPNAPRMPPHPPYPFASDPEIKEENVYFLQGKRRVALLERSPANVWLRDGEGTRHTYNFAVLPSESVLTQLREPHRFPQLSMLRTEMLGWRFYHQFRTDPGSPLRDPQVGVLTPVLSNDGSDLAAALKTIEEIGDVATLKQSVNNAFPGARLIVDSDGGYFSVSLKMSGIQRPFEARELSDGTLRYLCLLAALLTPRPPALMALNEPETSLHPDLMEPLALLIVHASRQSQLWITTHSLALARYIERHSRVPSITLEMVNGETKLQKGLFSEW